MTFKDIYEAIGESIESYGHHMIDAQAFYASIVDAHTALGELLEQDSKPKRISITINDDTIMDDIMFELSEMEFAEEVEFPTEEAKQEVAEHVADEIIGRCENDADYLPTWTTIWEAVHDAVRYFDYEKE